MDLQQSHKSADQSCLVCSLKLMIGSVGIIRPVSLIKIARFIEIRTDDGGLASSSYRVDILR